MDLSVTHSGVNLTGENFTLECSVSGTNVLAAFQWSNGRGDLDNNARDITISAADTTSNLHFAPLQQRHEGTYTCNVIIGGEMESKSINITVNGMLKHGQLTKQSKLLGRV